MEANLMPVSSSGGPIYDLKAAASAALSSVSRGSWGVEEMLKARRDLHRAAECEKEFSPEILDAEKVSATILRSHGIENRYTDALSKAAGTVAKSPRPATLNEVMMYLDHMGLDTMPIMIGQDMESGELFADVRNPILKGTSASILRGLNRSLPSSLALQPLTKQAGADANGFVKVAFPFHMRLIKRDYYGEGDFHVTTRGSLQKGLRSAAASASAIFKSSTDLPFHLVKGVKPEPTERIVTAVVLEPEVPDATRTAESDADIYSADEIRKAMFWWMEKSGENFTYYHKKDGGWTLGQGQVKLLENWQARSDFKEGTQDIRKGTWMASARIYDDPLWEAITKGEITGWSIGMYAMGQIEEVSEGKAP